MMRGDPAQPGASRSTHDSRCSAFLPGVAADPTLLEGRQVVVFQQTKMQARRPVNARGAEGGEEE